MVIDYYMKNPSLAPKDFSAIKLAWELGYTIIIPLILFALLGVFLDKRFNTIPLFTILGIILAAIISSIVIYKKVKPILEENPKSQIPNSPPARLRRASGHGKQIPNYKIQTPNKKI